MKQMAVHEFDFYISALSIRLI